MMERCLTVRRVGRGWVVSVRRVDRDGKGVEVTGV